MAVQLWTLVAVYGCQKAQQIKDPKELKLGIILTLELPTATMGILDITIENITQDEGLSFPYGIAEVELSVVYRLEY